MTKLSRVSSVVHRFSEIDQSSLEINMKKLRIFNLIVLSLRRTSVFEKYTAVFFLTFLVNINKAVEGNGGQCPPWASSE